MTALKPSEDRSARGVASTRYPINSVCAHPECDKPTESRHHLYPRSTIGNGSWFVLLDGESKSYSKNPHYEIAGTDAEEISGKAIPHVVGLCGSGTTGHHGDLEEHRAWVKLEDGVFVWWDRVPANDGPGVESSDWIVGSGDWWHRAGPLNPQPGSREGKPKRRKKASTPEERKARANYTVRTPKGEENILPELVRFAQETLQKRMESDKLPPPFITIVAALHQLIEGA